jgi:hypothetical protein
MMRRQDQPPRTDTLWLTYGVCVVVIAVAAFALAPLTTDDNYLQSWPFLLGTFGVLALVGFALRLTLRSTTSAGHVPSQLAQGFGAFFAGCAAATAALGVGCLAGFRTMSSQPPEVDTSFSGVLVVLALLLFFAGLVLWVVASATLRRPSQVDRSR